ncbi:MAG: hypothetical protein J6Y08_09795 [Clostridiales bacterium]|nr:hypothetical protein [Clostridiales bacterium]
MRITRKRGKKGSMVLEAAVSTPLVILLLVAMLSSITVVNTELYLRRATENVVSEVNLAIPFASNGILCLDDLVKTFGIADLVDVDMGGVDDVLGVIGEISGATGVQLEDVLTTATFGRYMRDRIVFEYKKLTHNSSIYDSLVDDLSVYLDYCCEDKSLYVKVFYEIRAGQIEISRQICTSAVMYADPLKLGDGEKKPDDDERSVWDQDNFQRGITFREKYGGNLPFNYPVISYYANHEAKSIKSIDTTSPYYQNLKKLDDKVKGYINDLAKFDGASWGSTVIGPGEITSRTLVIVIPENGSAACYQELIALKAYAASKGVNLVIEKYGTSGRYQENSSAYI